MNQINVATSLNSRYLRYTYVMLTSLYLNSKEEDIHVYILHRDLTEMDRSALQKLTDEFQQKIQFIRVDEKRFPADLPTTKEWTLEAYFRLLLPEVLPEDVKKILYLDVDMIINRSLQALYDIDFEDKLLCACPDPGVLEGFPEHDIRISYFEGKMTSETPYFNSGMLLLNIAVLREQGYTFHRYLDLAAELDYKIPSPDQDLLNLMHHGQVKYLDETKYNLFARLIYNLGFHYVDVKEAATIVHFPGMKPWEGQYVHYDIEQLWWDYAKLTPYYVELMEEFTYSSINEPIVYNTMNTLAEDKKKLQGELDNVTSVCQKLYKMLGQ